MATHHSFGAVLARVRKESGFPSAHAFYKGRDGRRNLGLTFRNYLNLEAGKSLPKPERLEAIVAALGLSDHTPALHQLVDAYLASLGLSGLIRHLRHEGKQRIGSEDFRMSELAARKALQQVTVQLGLDQWKARADDFDANTCHVYLLNTAGWVELKALARSTGLSADAARRAVKRLAAHGLAESSGSRARSLLVGKAVAPPPKTPEMVGVIGKMRKHQERWLSAGSLVRNSVTLVRLSKEDLGHFQQHLIQLMDLALLYGDPEKKAGTSVYLLRGQIFSVFDQEPKNT